MGWIDFEGMEQLEIILRAQKGDSDSMDYLLEQYKPLVRRKARTLFLIGGDGDDLVQEGMIGLFKAVQGFCPDREAGFATFADLCISRQLYSAIKKSSRKKNEPLNEYESLDDPDHPELVQEGSNPEDIVVEKEYSMTLMRRLKQRLSALERTVLDYYLEGKTYQEIAVVMGKAPKTIDNALQRIRQKAGKVLR